jgi:MFS family permease
MGIHFSTWQLLSLTAVLLLAFSAALGMAFNIDAIALAYDASNSSAGLVASAELAAIATGVLTFARFATRWPTRRVYVVAITLILLGNIASMFATGVISLLILRIPTGLALGVVSATSMATASRSATPESTFGVINAAVGVMGIIIAYILPRAINWHEPLTRMTGNGWTFDELDGLYIVYVVFGVLAYLFLRGVPSVHHDGSTPVAAKVAPGAMGWVTLFALGFLFFGHGSLGIFLVRVARELGLSGEVIGYVFMVGAVFGVAVPLIAGMVGVRMKPLVPMVVIVLLLLAACFTVATTTTAIPFYIAVPLFGSLPMAIMPILLGVLSRYDPSGTLAGAHAAFVLLGGAIAPFAGGYVRDHADSFATNGYFACICIALGFLLMLPIIRNDGASARHRGGSPAPISSH